MSLEEMSQTEPRKLLSETPEMHSPYQILLCSISGLPPKYILSKLLVEDRRNRSSNLTSILIIFYLFHMTVHTFIIVRMRDAQR